MYVSHSNIEKTLNVDFTRILEDKRVSDLFQFKLK